MRGIERRIDAGLKPDIASVASVFVSRWDSAVATKLPAEFRSRLGIAMAQRTYKAYRSLLSSPRWQRSYNAGARPQRLLWASTGPRTRQPLTCCTSNPWPHLSRSTPCLKALSRRWRITAISRHSYTRMEVTAKRCWRGSPMPGSMFTPLLLSFRRKAPRRSSNLGRN